MVDFTTLHPFDFDRNLFIFFNLCLWRKADIAYMLCTSINLHYSVQSYRMCYPGHLVGIVCIVCVTLSTCRLDFDSLQLVMDGCGHVSSS